MVFVLKINLVLYHILIEYKKIYKRNTQMHLEITPEMILSQLEYTINKSSLKQVKKAIKNTKEFERFAKHIISLNDNLKHMNAYVAMSNNTKYFKIKSENPKNKALLKEFHEAVKKWSNKYHVSLETIPNKEVYYIIGIKNAQ
jgi:ribonuclease D